MESLRVFHKTARRAHRLWRMRARILIRATLTGALISLGLLPLSLLSACDQEIGAIEEEALSNAVVTLRVENISAFTYDVLYAHMSPSLNLLTAQVLTREPIAPQGSAVIEHPVGAYLSAVRSLVARGPKVAIRSGEPLNPEPGQGRLQLLDEGFILAP